MNNIFKYLLILLIIIYFYLILNENKELFTIENDVFNQNIKKKSNKLNEVKKMLKGHWRDSCILTDYRAPLLWAECKNYFGHYKNTSINLFNCTSKQLKNIDGELEC